MKNLCFHIILKTRGKSYKVALSQANTMLYVISHEVSECQSKFVAESLKFME